MKDKTIQVYVKRPGEKPKLKTIENELKTLQSIVDGYIEIVTLTKDLVIICNEDGKLLGLDYNCRILGEDFVGPIIFAGKRGAELASLKPLTRDVIPELFPRLWEEEDAE